MIILFFVLVQLTGCAFFKLKEEIQIMQTNVAIGGELKTGSPQQLPITVIIYSEVDGQIQIQNVQVVDPADQFYFFIVSPGDYYLAAFEDANANFAHDDGEYFGLVGKPDRIRTFAQKPVDDLNIEVSRTQGFPSDFPTDISQIPVAEDKLSIAFGRITALDDDIFSDENARMGFWQPVTFIKKVGAGVWFLEPYDPAKTPILFVHGAAGSPRNFQAIAEQIDRSRYQPWFFYYPSGIPLEKVSRFLNDMVDELHKKYTFKELYVTAHSMGGLVARGFILRNVYDDGNDYIKLFVSISSPFGGLETAQKGVEQAPVAIPSWHDVTPGSEFIESIFSQPLAPKLDYYLLFSFKGDCSMFMDNNDGAVTLRSQLDIRAQKDAVKKWGFDKGHVEILSSPELLAEYSAILEKTDGRQKGPLNLFGLTD
jgi:pimeloyl-ACP methyl ester carboxylesterase